MLIEVSIIFGQEWTIICILTNWGKWKVVNDNTIFFQKLMCHMIYLLAGKYVILLPYCSFIGGPTNCTTLNLVL